MKIIREVLAIMMRIRILKMLAGWIVVIREDKRKKQRMAYMQVMICNKWLKKMRRNGADPEAIQTKRARNCITLVATSMYNLKYDKISMLIKPLFEQLLNLMKLRRLNA